MNIVKLHERLDQMVWLPPNWDGFGSSPIPERVYNLGKEIVTILENNPHITNICLLVGVEPEESLFIVIDISSRRIEMTIHKDSMIEYDEYIGGMSIGSGSFFFSKNMIDTILF